MTAQTIAMRVICENPPSGLFGLQDKSQSVVQGTSPTPDEAVYDFEINVQQTDDGQPNFTGKYAHGSVKERFLYLTTKGQDARIIRRIKVHLKTIKWSQVETVLNSPDSRLEVRVDGRGAASVPLLGNGWVVKTASSSGN
jgi:hypothetical protein